MTPPMDLMFRPTDWVVESWLDKNGLPFCKFTASDEDGKLFSFRLTLDQAREHVANVMTAVEVAASDAAMVRYLMKPLAKGGVGLPEAEAAAFLRGVRVERDRMEGDGV